MFKIYNYVLTCQYTPPAAQYTYMPLRTSIFLHKILPSTVQFDEGCVQSVSIFLWKSCTFQRKTINDHPRLNEKIFTTNLLKEGQH